MPVVYIFGDRMFRQPRDPYEGIQFPGLFVLDESILGGPDVLAEGPVLTIDGEQLTIDEEPLTI